MIMSGWIFNENGHFCPTLLYINLYIRASTKLFLLLVIKLVILFDLCNLNWGREKKYVQPSAAAAVLYSQINKCIVPLNITILASLLLIIDRFLSS